MKKQGNVFTICTGALDKGGIDHSTSAFRQIKIDNKNQLTSELRYTYIKESIEIAFINGRDAFKLPSGNIPVSVNIYDSNSPVEKVTFSYNRNGKNNQQKRNASPYRLELVYRNRVQRHPRRREDRPSYYCPFKRREKTT
ncbi:MAG: hypothetical protein LIO65_08740 [Odoribacter sp.]|nr:hypothetical protein [Odoribacter sp.]